MSKKKAPALPPLEAVKLDPMHKDMRPLRIVLTRHTDRVTCVRTTSKHVFTASEDGTARQFVIISGECIRVYIGHYGAIFTLAAHENHGLFSGGYDAVIRCWDTNTAEVKQQFYGHRSLVMALRIKDEFLYSGSTDGSVRSWQIATGECASVFGGDMGAVLSLEIGMGVIYTGTSHGRVRQFDLRSGVGMKSYTTHPTGVSNLVMCGANLITSDGRVRCFDAASAKCHCSLLLHNDAVMTMVATHPRKDRLKKAAPVAQRPDAEKTPGGLAGAVGNADGVHVITCSRDGTAKQFDLDRGYVVRSFCGHTGSIEAADITEDGKTLFTCTTDGMLRQYEVAQSVDLSSAESLSQAGPEYDEAPAPGEITNKVRQMRPSFCYGCMMYGHLPKKCPVLHPEGDKLDEQR